MTDMAFPSTGGMLQLRTLTLIRWAAIFGQGATLLIAHSSFGIGLPVGLCLLVIGLSIIGNLFLQFIYPQNTRLSEHQVFLVLSFDLAQLALLLWLTGGLTNPFVLLIVAPVTISATALPMRATLVLGGAAIFCVSALSVTHLPLSLPNGAAFTLPPLFAFGFWLAVVIGILFLGSYAHRVSTEIHAMQEALLATQMALARAQKLTDLGGVVAAAAHELGTPLATIKLVSAEMIDELDSQPELQADAKLIREQAERCREILRTMGRAGKDDLHMRQAPLSALIAEAAEPHIARGKAVIFALNPPQPEAPDLLVQRQPEVLHGLRNLIQNAVDFAESSVSIDATWTTELLVLRIRDDGPGFPPHELGRLGEPFLRSRKTGVEPAPKQDKRPGYEGMGLGLFIAKTLLERTGARLSFANLAVETGGGAVVEVRWPLDSIVAEHGPLGQNPLNM